MIGTWSDDPVRDAMDYAADLDRREEEYLKHNADCAECGQLIEDEEAVVIDPSDPFSSCLCLRCADRVIDAIRSAGLGYAADLVDDLFFHSRMETPNDWEE